jgi:hypothetical protein
MPLASRRNVYRAFLIGMVAFAGKSVVPGQHATYADFLGQPSGDTPAVYPNSRELHQPGEKPQVSSSSNRRNSVPPALAPAA